MKAGYDLHHNDNISYEYPGKDIFTTLNNTFFLKSDIGTLKETFQKYFRSFHWSLSLPCQVYFQRRCTLTHCVPVTFLRSRGKFMSGDTFPGGAFFSSEGRFFFFRGARFGQWNMQKKNQGGIGPPERKNATKSLP